MSNLIFFGTPDFAVPSLQALYEFCQKKGDRLLGVVCQPDKAADRGQKLHAPAIKTLAEQLGLTVWQPEKMTPEFIDWFLSQNVDLAVVVAYGKILPKRLLDASRLGFVNVHGSLLPRWRGAAPIQRAVEAGDGETGVCIMNLVPEMDAGEVYLTAKTPIGVQETSGELFERLAPFGADALIQALPGILNGTLGKIPQPEAGVTHAPKVRKDEALIDWTLSAAKLVNHCRAMDPWPGSYSHYQGKKLRLFGGESLDPGSVAGMTAGAAGQILMLGDRLVIAVRDGAVAFSEAQLEGRRRMPIRDLMNGFEMQVSEYLC
ncbi:MAG: methionyl-tRNA formyltransferase [Myxococcota bacterium]